MQFLTKKIFDDAEKGSVTRISLIEHKKIISAYVHFWEVTGQRTFHTHAFWGIAIVVRGGYTEEVILEGGRREMVKIRPGLRIIRTDLNHRIVSCLPGTVSITLAGPWKDRWIVTSLDGTSREKVSSRS